MAFHCFSKVEIGQEKTKQFLGEKSRPAVRSQSATEYAFWYTCIYVYIGAYIVRIG